MFVIEWDGDPPADKAEWIEILRDVFLGAAGTYWIRFHRGVNGWRFTMEHRSTGPVQDDQIANSPDSIRYAVYYALTEAGKGMDRSWKT